MAVPWYGYPILILVGFIPSLIWLDFYLRKDCHPEPKRRLVIVFASGMLLAPLAVAAQWLFGAIGGSTDSSGFFLWGAFVEEAVKFLAVFYLVVHSPDFDEPVDAMIYLVTAALGFAAVENILVTFRNIPDGMSITAQVLLWRTAGATLLHTLSSALVGYFFALAWFHGAHRRKLIWFGIGCATLFHFAFNMAILHARPLVGVLGSSATLLFSLILISMLFTKIRDRSQSRLSTAQ